MQAVPMLVAHHQVRVLDACQHLRAVRASPQLAQALEVPPVLQPAPLHVLVVVLVAHRIAAPDLDLGQRDTRRDAGWNEGNATACMQAPSADVTLPAVYRIVSGQVVV